MGAWDNGNLDNDTALDFIGELTNGNNLKSLEDLVDRIVQHIKSDGEIDADDASELLAGGEVVALIKGKPAPNLPDYLTQWHDDHQFSVSDSFMSRLIDAIKAVLANSELRELWEDNGSTDPDFIAWQNNVQDLIDRLESTV